MKLLRSLLMVAVVAGSFGTAFGQRNIQKPQPAIQDDKASTTSSSVTAGITNTPPGKLPVYSSVSAAGVSYRVFDSIINSFSYYTMNNTPMWYDPSSNLLVTALRGNNGDGSSSNDIYIRTSTNLGASWSAKVGPLHNKGDAGFGNGRYPSVGVANPSKATKPSDVFIYFDFPMTDGSDWVGRAFGLRQGDGIEVIPAQLTAGTSGTTSWTTDGKLTVSKAGDALIIVNRIYDGKSPQTATNTLAVRRFDATTGTAATVTPAEWDASVFSTTTGTGVTSTVAGVGSDDNAFYLGSYSRFPASDVPLTVPYPAISMSTNKGASWSQFNILPNSVLQSYATAQGGRSDSTAMLYSGVQDFEVTGNGKCSFVVPVTDFSSTGTLDQLAEAYYENGNWGMRKIADVRFTWFIGDAPDTNNQVENEVELSKTADGNYLLAKWVNLTGYIFNADIDGNGSSPDTLTTNDVFIAVRSTSKGTWSPELNVTSDPLLNHITHLPDILPNDLSNVPMICLITDNTGAQTLKDSLFDFQRKFNSSPLTHYVAMANFDATPAAGLKERTDITASGIRLNTPSPNPAKDRALITFTLPKAGRVTMDLFDAQGKHVKTFVNEYMESGNRGVALDTKDLASGTYTYTMTINGESVSKMLIVQK